MIGFLFDFLCVSTEDSRDTFIEFSAARASKFAVLFSGVVTTSVILTVTASTGVFSDSTISIS